MKNAKKFLVKIITPKISEKKAPELYSDLKIPDTAELEKSKSKNKGRINNILNALKNLESVFTDVYLNYSDKPSESESEESIAERIKLRRQRSDEIAKKEKVIELKLFREYFEYLKPRDMYKNLKKTTSSEENKSQVDTMKYRLANLMEEFKSNPTSDTTKN